MTIPELQHSTERGVNNKRESRQLFGIKTLLPLQTPKADTLTNNSKRQKHEGERSRRTKRSRHCSSQITKRNSQYISDSEDESIMEGKIFHIVSERKRRLDLRNAFNNLRILVPTLCHLKNASKVVILKEAVSHCNMLTALSDKYVKQVREMKIYQARLRARLSGTKFAAKS